MFDSPITKTQPWAQVFQMWAYPSWSDIKNQLGVNDYFISAKTDHLALTSNQTTIDITYKELSSSSQNPEILVELCRGPETEAESN